MISPLAGGGGTRPEQKIKSGNAKRGDVSYYGFPSAIFPCSIGFILAIVAGILVVKTITPLIMCGGAGTRLWPASREERPKQFLPLFGPYSTYQDTIRRVSDPVLFGRPLIVTNNQYRFLVAEQLATIGVEADIILRRCSAIPVQPLPPGRAASAR
jgi:Nucleotidyl transferase